MNYLTSIVVTIISLDICYKNNLDFMKLQNVEIVFINFDLFRNFPAWKSFNIWYAKFNDA